MNKQTLENNFFLILSGKLKKYFFKNLKTIILLVSAFVVLSCITTGIFFTSGGSAKIKLSDYGVGRVSDRDVVAVKDISYVDEEATRLRREASQRLVPAEFKFNSNITQGAKRRLKEFVIIAEDCLSSSNDSLSFALEIQEAFPVFDQKVTSAVYSLKDPENFLNSCVKIFDAIMDEGVVSIPDAGMESLNPSVIDCVYMDGKNIIRETKEISSLITLENLEAEVIMGAEEMGFSNDDSRLVYSIVNPFFKENVLFAPEETEKKLEAASASVTPIMVVIEKDQKIIRKGYIITDENRRDLEAAVKAGFRDDWFFLYSSISVLLGVLAVTVCLFSSKIITRKLAFSEQVFLTASFSLVYIVAVSVSHLGTALAPEIYTLLIPSSLMVMMAYILIKDTSVVIYTVVLALGVLGATEMSMISFLFVLLSGFAGIRVVNKTERRIDMVWASFVLSLINILIYILCIVVTKTEFQHLILICIGAAFNGFLSGILVTGLLPVFENLLNTATTFKLMELSDLNSPIMKKMLLAAPGSYSHSILVASLAENACREIGADPLLARVGGYYHDIGKMDQPEYFTENQTDYNKHDDLSPRLSATVIRSHVKLGVEKARQLHLPEKVIDIISEHHGNSVIAVFYSEALKQEENVNPEDFSYPGEPPSSKESAVVMLADTAEAACRSLQRPSVSRLEKFIKELFDKKIENGQLDNADLTFREMDLIRQSFVQTLAAYYHSRVEYPNQKDPDELPSENQGNSVSQGNPAPSGNSSGNTKKKKEE